MSRKKWPRTKNKNTKAERCKDKAIEDWYARKTAKQGNIVQMIRTHRSERATFPDHKFANDVDEFLAMPGIEETSTQPFWHETADH